MEPPRPVPRHRGISADNVPTTSLADHHAHVRSHTVPVPRPRQRNPSSGSDPIAEEDIYTDNSGPTTPASTSQNPPSKKVAWGEITSIDDGHSLQSEGPSSTGFDPRPLNAKPSWTGQPIQTLTGQMGAMNVGSSKDQGLPQRELDIQRREADLLRREERLRSEQSDHEFKMTERERELQYREDDVHTREKLAKQKEFEILNSDPGDAGGAGERLANVAEKEIALEERSRELDMRERQLDMRERQLQAWDLHLKQRESTVSQIEAGVTRREAELSRSPVYQQPPQQYPPPTHQPYTQQFDYPPQGGQQYYNPPQGYAPQGQVRQHAYTQPQLVQPSTQPTYAPQSPPNLPPKMQTPVMSPAQHPPRAGGTALPAPLTTPKPRVSVDEEIATALGRAVPQKQAQIDKDAEMAKKLFEQQEQEWKAKLDMDAQIALLMQHQEVEGQGQEDVAVPQDFTAAVDSSSSTAQEAIQKRIQEQIARQREMEEADRRLAEQLAKEGETDNIPAPNDLDS